MAWFKKDEDDTKAVKELQETIAVLKVVALNLKLTAEEFENQIQELKELNQGTKNGTR